VADMQYSKYAVFRRQRFNAAAVGAEVPCPGYHRKKCLLKRPPAERRRTGTDPVTPLDSHCRCRQLRHIRWSISTREVDRPLCGIRNGKSLSLPGS